MIKAIKAKMVKHYSELSPEELKEKLEMHLHDLGLSPSNVGTLDKHGIVNLGDLLRCTKDDLLSMSQMGEKTYQNILGIIRGHGFY